MRLEDFYADYTPFSAKLLQEKLVERFWAKVDISDDPTSCWEWKGSLIPGPRGGYGRFFVYRQGYRAHRIAFMLVHGEVDDDLLVCHSCDNRLCCNPAHLWQGTNQENTEDAVQKGRHFMPQGEKSGSAKLTGAKVLDIRERYDPANGVTQENLAREHGVNPTQIGRIIRRVDWTHI